MALEKNIRLAKDAKDVELEQHYKDLDNFGLKSSGWTQEPLENVQNDFVSALLDNYLKDLEKRKQASVGESAKHVDILRKCVDLHSMTEIISVQYDKIGGLKRDADAVQSSLENEKRVAEHKKKVAQLTS
jgi:hypothetical protein